MVSLSAAARLPAQAAPDPWRRVPPLTAHCYGDDDFVDKVAKARESVEADLSRQEATNSDLKAQMTRLPPGEVQRRTQEYMASHPQEAMKAMQAMQASAQAARAGTLAAADEIGTLDEELTTRTTEFQAALEQAKSPSGQVDCNYDKVCPAWWGAKGAFPAWLGRYKAAMVKQVSSASGAEQVPVAQLAMMGLETAGYHSTDGLRAVRDYLGNVAVAYRLRPQPQPGLRHGH